MRNNISGGEITLKKYEMEFAPLLYEAARESCAGELSRWMPWCKNYSLAESRSFIEKSLENWSNEIEFDYAVFQTETNKFAGGISLNLFNHERKSANLGYWVRLSSQNQGIAHRATKMLAKAAFEDIDLI